MKRIFNSAALLSAMFAALTFGASLTMAKDNVGAESQVSGNLVIFLTQTDPMVAGHALHFATRMVRDGRPSRVILVGEAGRLGLAGHKSSVSAVNGEDLQTALKGFIDAGGDVFMTRFTLASYGAQSDSLIEGVALPSDPSEMHATMFDPNTQMLAW